MDARQGISMLANLTPDQRRAEVAEILGRAVARLRIRGALPATKPVAEKPPESISNCLDASRETVLSVHTG
jgi:hypothetical protein